MATAIKKNSEAAGNPARVIVAGARGLIGRHMAERFKSLGVEVLELDIATGHDLSHEAFVKEWFAAHPAQALVNAFALNDHVGAPTAESNCLSNRLMDVSLESFDRFLSLNLTTLFSVCREYARNNATGRIVNFTSVYGLVSPLPSLYGGDEKHVAYGVSKAGVVQLTKHLAVHLAPGIRVNCVAPGGVEHMQDTEFRTLYAEHTPMGRMMTVDEVFGIVEFLVSEKSSYCTGGVFTVDGGWTAW